MRLFLGVALDEAARAELGLALTSARHALGECADAFRWTPVENLHVTLHFLGSMETPRLEILRAAIADPIGGPPFEAETGAWGRFPPSGLAKVLWIGLASGATDVTRIHADLGSRLRGAGFATEARAFTPHVTVARARDRSVRPRAVAAWPAAAATCSARWRIDHVTLFESDVSGSVPKYVPRMHIPVGR